MLIEWWTSIGWAKQVLGSLAIVASFLLLLWLILHWFGLDHEEETNDKKHIPIIDTKAILLFFMFFGWSAFLIVKNNVLFPSLLYAILIGILFAAGSKYSNLVFLWRTRKRAINLQQIRESTGEVLVSIPPHRNGFGKVHLNMRGAPNELEAMTAGQAIQPGMSVRVIDVIDNEVLVVEPVNKPGPKAPNMQPKGFKR